MPKERMPTEEDVAKMHEIIDEVMNIFYRERVTLNEVIKVATAIVVRGFESSVHQDIPREIYDAMVVYYANASTSAVNFLQDGVINNDPADFIKGTHKDVAQ